MCVCACFFYQSQDFPDLHSMDSVAVEDCFFPTSIASHPPYNQPLCIHASKFCRRSKHFVFVANFGIFLDFCYFHVKRGGVVQSALEWRYTVQYRFEILVKMCIPKIGRGGRRTRRTPHSIGFIWNGLSRVTGSLTMRRARHQTVPTAVVALESFFARRGRGRGRGGL